MNGPNRWLNRGDKWVSVEWLHSTTAGLAYVRDPERGNYHAMPNQLKRNCDLTSKVKKLLGIK